MKYTIKEILPGQIRVEFEDGSWAMVPIRPEATPEEVDNAVSQYDRDFLPDPETITNKNISVDEVRVSKAKTDAETDTNTTNVTENNYDANMDPVQTTLYGGLPLPKFHKDQVIITYFISEYFIKNNNDYSLKEELDKMIEEYIQMNNITPDMALESLIYSDDDIIMELAEEQLNAE